MEFDQNRAARPFNITLLDMLRALRQLVKSWRLRRETRRILSHLSDTQLRDIGLTRGDIDRRN
ncbi:DUF1127 domain-containing protein [Erwiniaceae bacterium L1_54_6]|jgi:uncharacterized protein YjiS (DUF1127 family)|uniref:DUF1127 domain-containing protein n=1 Tax=Pantoea cypripedii TaxID=55209 RepID=A0A1X1EPQ4_PANCY|nr:MULTISPECIES: DUF1127 domain-containing protein [Pantoea]MDF7662976.1 DUF1127 domain-containing protein [Erwiniaceae bacterium L1_54_6]MBP2196009.1 uncharacterized protein YjiS (DUF1127 family) [Pantoea cypripedii]MDE1188564.1 DUF1127 domain-containing protein [Pantoea sp.]ORM91971.1 DUF1127 domain-containing protein [Pantoea cypripedii]QGY27577.1 DUF1127 domain-containing protein [Pantoea cypripedii]